jgi:pimeloyl-ACP methyl ester carboxylesterase
VRPFETSLGTILLHGIDFTSDRPAVLGISGAFAKPDEMERLPLITEPARAGFVTHLPGNHCPPLRETSIEAFAQALDEVLAQLARPFVIVGLSVGGLVALAMKTPRGVVAVDPPLTIANLWPMPAEVRADLPLAGIDRPTYHHLIDGLAIPTHVVVGSELLFPQRAISRFPSLVSQEDRAFMAANPHVRLSVAPNSGHDIPRQAGAFLFERMQEMCVALI